MPSIRPEPVDTFFETPAMADTGALDYYKNLTYDTLYHSPVSSLSRMSGLFAEKNDDTTEMLSAEEATKQYGVDDELKFDEPIRQGAAVEMQQRKLAELRREYELQSGSGDNWGRKISGFGVSMVSQLIDPVNLAAMFLPVVGENRALTGIQRASSLLERGLISPKTLAKMVGTSPLGYRLGKGAIEGLVGTAITRPLDIIPTLYEGGHYDWTDEAKNLGTGAILGAGLHAVVGAIFDKFKAFREGMKQLNPETHEANVMGAVSDLMQDKPVMSPEKITSVDHTLVSHDIEGRYDEEEVPYTRFVEQMPTDIRTKSPLQDETYKFSNISLNDGYKLVITRPNENDGAVSFEYQNKEGKKVGHLDLHYINEGGVPAGWWVDTHDVEGARGKGLGRQAISKLANQLGEIRSSTGMSPEAEKMWKAIGSRKDKVEDHGYGDVQYTKLADDTTTSSQDSINSEIHSRVQQIAQAESKPTSQKVLDQMQSSSQALDKSDSSPPAEPVEHYSTEEMKEFQSDLQAESAEWEKMAGELKPEEQNFVNKALNPDANAIKSAVGEGVNCILNKAL